MDAILKFLDNNKRKIGYLLCILGVVIFLFLTIALFFYIHWELGLVVLAAVFIMLGGYLLD